MVLKVNGIPYTNFISLQAEVRLDVLCNTFSGVMARTNEQALPFKMQDKCEVLVDGQLIFTGKIEVMAIKYGKDYHYIELAGRDATSDLLDSTIDEMDDLAEGATLKNIIEQVITHLKSPLIVTEDFKVSRFNPDSDIAAPEPGTNAFNFLEPLARQRQVLLTSNAQGNVVLARGSGVVQENARIQSVIRSNPNSVNNNVLEVDASYDNTGRYNLYKISGYGNPSALGDTGSIDLGPVVEQSGRTIDKEMNIGRQLVLSAESTLTDDDSFNRATWEANIRRARGRVYNATVKGYSIGGNIWQINRLIPVDDDFADIHGKMLINSTLFTFDKTKGSRTRLMFMEPDTFTLVLDKAVAGEEFF